MPAEGLRCGAQPLELTHSLAAGELRLSGPWTSLQRCAWSSAQGPGWRQKYGVITFSCEEKQGPEGGGGREQKAALRTPERSALRREWSCIV